MKTTPLSVSDMKQGRLLPGKMLVRHALALLLALAGSTLAANPACAGWKLVDEHACDGPIASLSEGLEPLEENCTPATAGKDALCFTEVCRPHCLYFNYSLEQCQRGAEIGKRYICVPE